MAEYSGGSSARRTLQGSPNLRLLQLGVAQRRANVAVTQHTLHDLDALALRDQLTAARMAELVWCIPRRAGRVEEPSCRAELRPLVVHRVVEMRGTRLERNTKS